MMLGICLENPSNSEIKMNISFFSSDNGSSTKAGRFCSTIIACMHFQYWNDRIRKKTLFMSIASPDRAKKFSRVVEFQKCLIRPAGRSTTSRGGSTCAWTGGLLLCWYDPTGKVHLNKIAYDILGEEMVLICLWWFFSGFSEGEMWLGPGMISCHLRKWLGLYMLYTWMITYGDPFKVTTLKERYQLAVGIFAMFWDNCSATSIHRWRVSQEINCLSRVFLSFVVVWRWNSPLYRPFFGDAKCHSYTWVLPPIPATNSCKFDSTYQYRLLQYFSWKLSYINIDFPQFLGCVSHAQEYVIFLGRITVIRSKATIKLMMVSG